MNIAALYVETSGVYFGLDGVDPWDEQRDARSYAGPHPVVAHPPCKRWGRYWSGGPSAKVRRKLGDDGGCFAFAWAAVRTFGGVIEHPEASHAWRIFGIPAPPKSGGWIPVSTGGWTCCVEQGHYGHAARKATWLYVFGRPKPPDLLWGPAEGKTRLDPGFHSKAERDAASADDKSVRRLSAQQRISTPKPFRDLLINIARTCRRGA
ncbi:MAG: hypothetical protein AAFP15_16510 [Bacteroidota bacterium]